MKCSNFGKEVISTAPAGLDQIIDEAFVDCTNGNFSKADLLAISTSYMVLKKHIRERYRPAPSSEDEGLREELEDILDLGDDVAKHMDITIKGEPTVLVSYIKEILSRHPPAKSDRCEELVKELEVMLDGRNDYFVHLNGEAMKNRAFIPKQMIQELVSEFSKDADGKEGR